MGGYYFFVGSNLEKYGKFWKNSHFSGRMWLEWGNTAWADMAGLGCIGLMGGLKPTKMLYIARCHATALLAWVVITS